MKVIVIGLDHVNDGLACAKIAENMASRVGCELVVACLDTDLQKQQIDDTKLMSLYEDRVTFVNRSLLDTPTLSFIDSKKIMIEDVQEKKMFSGKNITPKKKKRKKR